MNRFSLKKALTCAAALLTAVSATMFSACDEEKLPENLILTAPDTSYLAPDALGVYLADGNMLQVKRGGTEVMNVQLGLKSDKTNYDISSMTLKGGIPKKAKLVAEQYRAVSGKRSECSYRMNEKTLVFANQDGSEIGVTIRLGADSFAFRYELDGAAGTPVEFQGESTAYHFPETDTFRLQRRELGYEDRYPEYAASDLPDKLVEYPIFFHNADKTTWGLISETGFDGSYCGCLLKISAKEKGVIRTTYPEQWESNGHGAVNPKTSLPWKSPWRAAVIGSLANIVESTLIDDLAPECAIADTSWIQPGMAAWVYWAHNNGSRDFQVVKDYINLAADMKWPNVLIDWEWDVMGNGGNIDDALALAKEKGVGVWLWYNSGGEHTGVMGGPRDRFITHEAREKEFAWLTSKGVKGVKIDFFGGDKQDMMQYYVDILRDAAAHKIMVDFHGCTLPRGWSRTWPNLMSMEAVFGAEMYNNNDVLTEAGAEHNTTLPFIRNVVGPMDYTPTAFTDSQHRHTTSHAHELALPVVFESAAQHMADRPSSFRSLPDKVKAFLAVLPTAWDDTKYLGGEPGDSAILARRKGNTWYVGGINGKNESRTFSFKVPGNPGETFTWEKIGDGENRTSFGFADGTAKAGDVITVDTLGRGGFVFTFTKLFSF